jgi:hypothetical protein
LANQVFLDEAAIKRNYVLQVDRIVGVVNKRLVLDDFVVLTVVADLEDERLF